MAPEVVVDLVGIRFRMTSSAPPHLVFMLEEETAEHVLGVLLPQVLPAGVSFQCIPHQGKSDLQKSIPIKLRAWQKPNSFFVILHDLDNHPDCIELKARLRKLCADAKGHTPLIRIVCRELEAWYFGDLDAVERAYPGFRAARLKRRAGYRHPDAIANPGMELKKIVKGFSKGAAARRVPRYMDIAGNTSTSFNNTIAGIRNLVETRTTSKDDTP